MQIVVKVWSSDFERGLGFNCAATRGIRILGGLEMRSCVAHCLPLNQRQVDLSAATLYKLALQTRPGSRVFPECLHTHRSAEQNSDD